MSQVEAIKVDVPEGHLPQSMPCDPTTRIDVDAIELKKAEAEDMLEIAKGIHASFPEIWWAKHEPLTIRAEPEIRARRLAKRLEAYAKHPEILAIKAVQKSTGEFMGFAGWQFISKPPRHGAFGYEAILDESEDGWGFQKLMGWSDEELKEMWKDIDLASWVNEFHVYDGVRKEEMGTQPHWYLAPLFVVDKFRGRGVGRLLLDVGIQQADKHDPPLPLYLEALPNARPVYMHVGFEGVDDSRGPNRGPIMIRRAKKAQ